MRINCHAHIFNTVSVFNAETLEIFLRRIKGLDVPDLVKTELAKQLEKLFTKAGDFADEETLFKNVIVKVAASEEFRDVLSRLPADDQLKLELEGGANLKAYAVEKLVTLLGRISESLGKDDQDAAKVNMVDIIAFLRIALLPTIRHVTDVLMEQLTIQDGVVALMMDITNNGSDAKQYEKQLADTSAQVLAYPGRVFPFVAVNTKRPDHFSIMENALNGRGFVGVKLYPSLGYEINSGEMFKVYSYCEEREIPLLMHCSEGGFNLTKETYKNSDPMLWDSILSKHPNLKICFGHFGGAENISSSMIKEWTLTILDLMTKYSRVYADIAFHSEPMKGGEGEKLYFSNLSSLLSDERYRGRILFGSDYFMSRQRLSEKSYWNYFKKNLSDANFQQIAELNPVEYLGLPTTTRSASVPIQNYVAYIYQNRDTLLSIAADWLKDAVKTKFGQSAILPKPSLGPKWSWNNKVHAYLYMFLEEGQLSSVLKKKGFDGVGMLKLRDMAYWNKGFEAKDIWNLKLKAMTENLDTFIGVNGGSYEKNQDTKKAMAALVNHFDNGAMYIFELGEKCDAIYKFS